MSKYLLIFMGLTTGNLIYACFFGLGDIQSDIVNAFERSFFQGVALFLAWLIV